MEENLLIRWVVLYPLTSVSRRGEREKHTHALARLTSPGWGERSGAGRGVAKRGETMDARRAREAEIRPKAS
jgi:hypothetical protein